MPVVLSVRELMRNLVFYVHFFNVKVISKMKSHSFINQGQPLCRISRVYKENFYIREKKLSPFSSYLHKIKFST